MYSPDYIKNHSDNDYKELIPPMFVNRHRINTTHEHVCFTFFARAKTDVLRLTQGSEKSENVKWLTLDEVERLEGDFAKGLKEYVRKGFELLNK